eukprot:gene14958-17685_t
MTLSNAKSKFRGVITGDSLEWEEYEAIAEADQLELPQTYQARFSYVSNKATIKGQTTTNPTNPSTFQLAMTAKKAVATPPPPKPLDLAFLVDGAEFEGNLVQDFNLSLKVTSRKSDKSVEGTIDWVDFSTKTKFRGTLEGNAIKFTEYEVISGDGVELPTIYTGTISDAANTAGGALCDDLLSGEYKLDITGGKFNLAKV